MTYWQTVNNKKGFLKVIKMENILQMLQEIDLELKKSNQEESVISVFLSVNQPILLRCNSFILCESVNNFWQMYVAM